MARFAVAGRSTVIGTTARACFSVFAIASRTVKIREVGVFNTTSTAVSVALTRFTAATNVGAALTEVPYDEAGPANNATAFAGHTGDGTASAAFIRQASLGAAVGSGVIWTFGDTGVIVAAGTANGIGVICPNGTGQILDYYVDFDE